MSRREIIIFDKKLLVKLQKDESVNHSQFI